MSLKMRPISICTAVEDVKSGKFSCAYAASKFYVKKGTEWIGKGRKLQKFTGEEEKKITDLLVWRVERGFGYKHHDVALLIQELLKSVCASNRDRVSGWEGADHFPDESFVYNFARRNKLVLRTTTELSNAMNQLTYRDLELKGLVSNPKFSACFQDPRRIFNMDESPFGIGESKPRIWANE